MPVQALGAQPRAWNIEAGYDFDLFDKVATVAVGPQDNSEAVALEPPKKHWIAIDAIDNKTTLSCEWARDEDDGISNGVINSSGHTLTAQLVVEFLSHVVDCAAPAVKKGNPG